MPSLEQQLRSLVKDVRTKHFPKGQILLYKDDYPIDVLILKKGVVKLYDEDKKGNVKILHIVKPYAVIPFAVFSGGKEAIKWFYSAITDCDIAVITFEEFSKKLKNDFELYDNLTHWFSVEVHELLVRLSSMGKTTAKAKIVSALTFLAVHNSKNLSGNWLAVTFPVNHQLLADMTGVSRERAAIIMKELTDKKQIRNPRQNSLEINLQKLINNH